MHWRKVSASGAMLMGLGAVLLGTIPMFPRSPQGRVGNGPCLRLSQQNQDLGRVAMGEVREVRFQLANVGTSRLVINTKNEACCGSGAESGFVIQPGETGDWRARVDVGDTAGPFERRFEFTTSDPQHAIIALTVRGVVVPMRDMGGVEIEQASDFQSGEVSVLLPQ